MSRYILVSECGLDERTVEIPTNLIVDRNIQPCSIEDMIASDTPNEKHLTDTNPVMIEDQLRVEGDKIEPNLIYCVKNVKTAKSLLNFCHFNGFNADKDGKLIYKNKLYDVNIIDHFIDLCDGGSGRKMRGHKLLYPLLVSKGLKDVHSSRRKYF